MKNRRQAARNSYGCAPIRTWSRTLLATTTLALAASGCGSGGSPAALPALSQQAAGSVNAVAPATTLSAGRVLSMAATHGVATGSVPSNSSIDLYISLAGQHDDQLDSFVRAVGSSPFAHYLTADQYGAYFGASASDYNQALAILRAHGFVIDETPANRRDIVAHASAAAVSALFGTPLDTRVENGRAFYAARYEPVLPVGLHAIAVVGLDNYGVMHSHMEQHTNIGGTFSYAPVDVANVYSLNALYSAGLNGKGVTIANVTADGPITASDLSSFEKQFSLPSATLITQNYSTATSDSTGESSADAEWATAVAPGATFEQVVSKNTGFTEFTQAYSYVVNSLSSVHVATTSWGACEADMSSSNITADETLFKQAAAEGQHWFSASGDQGTNDCGNKTQSVDYPASSSNVMSVGGTVVDPNVDSGTVTSWQSEVAWGDGVGDEGRDAGGGGGPSKLFSKPSYQTGVTPADGHRDTPDVSLNAAGAGYWIYCKSEGGLEGEWYGTSFASPMWAGLFAIIEQKNNNAVITDPHTRIYQLASSSSYASLFHDITSGNNSADGVAGFSAGPRYDEATGWGSYIGSALVNAY